MRALSWSGRRRLWWLLGAMLSAAGCPPARAPPAAASKACSSNQDCEHGWACLAGRCYDTRKSAAFTHPEQQVTPDRVRQELEHQQQEHTRRMENDLQGAEGSGGGRATSPEGAP